MSLSLSATSSADCSFAYLQKQKGDLERKIADERGCPVDSREVKTKAIAEWTTQLDSIEKDLQEQEVKASDAKREGSSGLLNIFV